MEIYIRFGDCPEGRSHNAETGEFEQKIINVSGGGIFIESAQDSAITVGDNNTVSNTRGNGGGGGHGDS